MFFLYVKGGIIELKSSGVPRVKNQAFEIPSSDQSPIKPNTSSLHAAVRMAIAHVIADNKGRTAEELSLNEGEAAEDKTDESDVALAVAYTSLMVEDPEGVTNRHLKMLRRRFSIEQIKELNELIRRLSA